MSHSMGHGMGPISADWGRVISGRLVNRFGSPYFGANTKLLRGVIQPISVANQYLNTVFVCVDRKSIQEGIYCISSFQRETYSRG